MNINKKINNLFGAAAFVAMIAVVFLVFYLALFAPV
jgi:hypothetical protein